MKLKPYPKYKDSGIEWLGEAPEGWEILKLKYGSDVIMGQSPSSDNYSDDSDLLPFLQGNADFTTRYPIPRVYCDSANKIVSRGSILLSVRAPVGALNEADQEYGIGRGLCAINPKSNLLKEYAWYQLHVTRMELDSLATGSTYDAVSVDEVADMTVLVPPIEDQQAIATFLDRETSRIDALIQKKERLIELLKEKRIALITQAVTKGLDPNVPMKNSGIEWLGEVPEHWETTKVGFGYSIQLGKMLQPEPDKPSDVLVNYLKAVNVQWDEITVDDESLMWASNSDLSKYRIEQGDLLVCEGGEAGRAAILEFEAGEMIIQNALHRVRSSDNNVRYLLYLLQVASNQGWFDILCNKATIAHFTRDKFSELRIPYPPVREQDVIVSHIQDVTQRTSELVDKLTTSLALLREYRSSLINAAVTGKIDLRDAL